MVASRYSQARVAVHAIRDSSPARSHRPSPPLAPSPGFHLETPQQLETQVHLVAIGDFCSFASFFSLRWRPRRADRPDLTTVGASLALASLSSYFAISVIIAYRLLASFRFRSIFQSRPNLQEDPRPTLFHRISSRNPFDFFPPNLPRGRNRETKRFSQAIQSPEDWSAILRQRSMSLSRENEQNDSLGLSVADTAATPLAELRNPR